MPFDETWHECGVGQLYRRDAGERHAGCGSDGLDAIAAHADGPSFVHRVAIEHSGGHEHHTGTRRTGLGRDDRVTAVTAAIVVNVRRTAPSLGWVAMLARCGRKVRSKRCGRKVRPAGAVKRCGRKVRTKGAGGRCGQKVRWKGADGRCGHSVRGANRARCVLPQALVVAQPEAPVGS